MFVELCLRLIPTTANKGPMVEDLLSCREDQGPVIQGLGAYTGYEKWDGTCHSSVVIRTIKESPGDPWRRGQRGTEPRFRSECETRSDGVM